MTTRRKGVKNPAESVGIPPVIAETSSTTEGRQPISIGQQITIIREFKGPRGMIRIGTNSVVEGCEVSGDKSHYKILHRGFRLWVPEEVVEPRQG